MRRSPLAAGLVSVWSLLAVAAGSVSAATYYVEPPPTGNNANPGTTQQPWATLQHAANQVQPGDTVIVRAGTYAGFNLSRTGTNDTTGRITFSAMSGVVVNQRNATTPDYINLENVSYATIEGFTVQGNGTATNNRTGIRAVGPSGVSGGTPDAFVRGVHIRNNTITDCWKWGILAGFVDDMIIENNRCSGSLDEHGIYFSNSADNPIIRNNTCFNNCSNGIHINADIETGNTNNPRVDGIITHARVYGNILHTNGIGRPPSPGDPGRVGGGSGINCDGVQNSLIYNNLIYNTSASGISLYRINGGGPASGNVVINNTVIVAQNGRWAMNIQDGAINTTLFNNVFFSYQSFRGAIDISPDSLPGLVSNYNVMESRLISNDVLIPFASWQAAGRDVNSQVVTQAQLEALFVNHATRDFRPAPASALINSGISALNGTNAPTTDLPGNPRPAGGAWDVGAYEVAGDAPQLQTVRSRKLHQ